MADATPDWKFEMMRLIAQRSALVANLERFRQEIMEVQSRTANAQRNIRATKEAISDIDKNLQPMIDAHGPVDFGLVDGEEGDVLAH